MHSLWNDSSILPPPVRTFPHKSQHDITELKLITKNIIKILNKQSPLYEESFLMARFLYKFDKKFRNDIGFQYFKKVNTALNKCFKLNFVKEVKTFMDLLPQSQDDLYLPSKQMLEYLLTKLQTYSKILLRICVCSKKAAVFYLNRVRRGESYWMSLMPYALLSRIWSLCLVLLQHSFSWYTQFHKYLTKLQLKGLPFLPAHYQLPENLEKWLDFDNFEDYGRIDWQERKKLDIKINFIEDEEANAFQDILDFVKQINDDPVEPDIICKKIANEDQVEIVTRKSDDCGVVVSRDSFESSINNKTALYTSGLKLEHSPLAVTNRKSLIKFINTEETFRYSNNPSALTLHLSFMQWQALKQSLTNLDDSLSKNNHKIQKKFLKLWQEKCLDYLE